MYENFELFDLKWRFRDQKFRKLKTFEIERMSFLNKDISKRIWISLFGESINHLMDITNFNYDNLKWILNETKEVDSDKFESGKEFLLRYNIDNCESIFFFWSPTVCIATDWGLFTKYWNDFCYPSDDNNVIFVLKHNKLFTYVEDNFFYYDSKINCH